MRRYNQSAKVYDTQYSEEQEAKIKTIMKNLRLAQNVIVLDAGCGTGVLIKHIAEKSRFFVGVDVSRGLLREARKKAQPHKSASLVLADVDNMPFPKQVFGAVLAITLLQNTPDPQTTLTEVERVSEQAAPIVVTGLRKRFIRKDFLRMLRRAGLRVEMLKLDEKNREYVCICKKRAALSLNLTQNQDR